VSLGVCAIHPDRSAAFTCARCGDHGCESCAFRVVPTAQPICAECRRRRETRVATLAKDDGSNLCKYALGLGVVALVPMLWPAQLGSIVLALVALHRTELGNPSRVYAVIGGVLGALGLLGTVLAFVYISSM
jgi:hypothetical protein